MSRILQVFTAALTLILSVLLGFNAVLISADNFDKAIASYLQHGKQLSVANVLDDQADEVTFRLAEFIEHERAIIFRADRDVDEEGPNGYTLGVAGDADRQKRALNFSYLGTTIFDSEKIKLLLSAEPGKNKTLGLYQTQSDTLAPLPEVRGLTKLVIFQLGDLIKNTKTVNGNYVIYGVDEAAFEGFVQSLSEFLHIDPERLTNPLHGAAVTDALLPIILGAAILATWVSLVFLLILGAYQSVSVLGTHILLGWSRTEYVSKEFAWLLWISAASAIPALGMLLFYMQGFGLTFSLFTSSFSTTALNITLTLAAIFFASLVIYTIPPVNAIRKRVSRKVLGVCLLVFYLVASAGIVQGSLLIDGPLEEVKKHAEIQQRWSPYSDVQVLSSHVTGDDATTFRGQSLELKRNYYDWYKSFEGADGAYIVKTFYYGDALLDTYRMEHAYEHVPEKSFWSMAASPNYLADQGMSVPEGLLETANRGIRTYLIPDTLTGSEEESLREYLREKDLKDYAQRGIVTLFDTVRDVAFYRYHPDRKFFLWNADADLPNVIADPVVLVTTAANMSFFESESLAAVGLDNAYFHFKKSVVERYTTPEYLARYGLVDNKPKFLSVSNYIAGLQKNFENLVVLFGGVIMVVGILAITIVASLVKFFALSKREEIAVKRLLGFGLGNVFWLPVVVIVVVSLVGVVYGFAVRTNTGVFMIGFLGCLELLMLVVQAKRSARSQLAVAVKEG